MGQKLSLPATVHIVDDDASFLIAVERYLKLAGYDVLTYLSAMQLLDRLPDGSRAGCILLDVRLSDMSGPDVQDSLHKLGSTLPIVFVSGQADIPTAVRAIKAGAADFLTKAVGMYASGQQATSNVQAAQNRPNAVTAATVCFSMLGPTLHGSPALYLAADVVVLPLHTRHRHRQHAMTCLQHYP
jgi:FixJ family two-component response regulator